MGIDIALIVAAWNAALELGLLQMAARPIDAVLCNGGNGAVGRPGCRLGGAELDDAADTANSGSPIENSNSIYLSR